MSDSFPLNSRVPRTSHLEGPYHYVCFYKSVKKILNGNKNDFVMFRCHGKGKENVNRFSLLFSSYKDERYLGKVHSSTI